MKNSNIHAILSDVHRLLSQYTPDEFVAASHYSGVSSEIRAILLALAHKPLEQSHQTEHARRRREQLHGDIAKGNRLSRRQPPNRDTIIAGILKSPRFASSRAILEFAALHGIDVHAKPKDGRDRLARRLVAAVESAPDAVRDDLLTLLESEKGSQTQGWIDVIKGARA